MKKLKTGRIDPITLGIMANRLDSITREMTSSMLRTARSTTMAARDFSCSITSSDHELLSAPGGIPVHVYGSALVSKDMEKMHPDFAEGDAFLHNDPYMGNTHAADHTIIVPVFYKGEHVFTSIAKAHQIDIGNAKPTTYMPSARNVYEEGALIFPCVRVQKDFKDVQDIILMAKRRIRVPETWYGDFLASVGACRLAEKRLQEFCDTFESTDAVRLFIREWLNYGERMAKAGISKLPAGKFTARTKMDPFPGLPEGMEITATVEVKPEEGKVVIDLRDNPDCTPTGLNLTESTSANAAVTAVLMVLNTDKLAKKLRVPNTSGSHRQIEVLLRENCAVGIPRHPACCSTATRTLTDRITGMLLSALAVMSDFPLASAEPCYGCPPSEAVVSGADPKRGGEEFILQIFSGQTGGPATAQTDGWLTLGNIMGAGISRLDASEIVEQRYPLVIWEHAGVRIDSEGAGEYRSAPGCSSAYGPRHTKAESHYYLEGVVNRPIGVRGGGSPLGPAAWLLQADRPATVITDTVAAVRLDHGEAIVSLGAGAGGYGSPLNRKPEAVLNDVIDEYISGTRARECYGVVLCGDPTRWETLSVDVDATIELRSKLALTSATLEEGRAEALPTLWWAAA